MKRQTYALFALLLILVGVYFLFIYKGGGADNIFHVEDVTAIHKVELQKVVKGAEVGRILLERDAQNAWLVDSKYPANEGKLKEFLNLLGQIRVKKPIAEKGQASALSILKRNHTRVDIYDRNGSVLRSYFVGATNSKQTANIMMNTDAGKAYLVSKPGTEGYVSIFYSTNLLDWRERLLFDIEGDQLRKVSITYSDAVSSFSIQRADANSPWTIAEGINADEGRVRSYLSLFEGKVFAESFANAAYPEMRDSLTRRMPDIRFNYESLDGQSYELLLFARPENVNNFFGYTEGGKELYTVQHFVFDKFLKTLAYFQPSGI